MIIAMKIVGILFALALTFIGVYTIIATFAYGIIDTSNEEDAGMIGIGLFGAALMAGLGIKLFGFICGWWPFP